jgi:hypothetical protein
MIGVINGARIPFTIRCVQVHLPRKTRKAMSKSRKGRHLTWREVRRMERHRRKGKALWQGVTDAAMLFCDTVERQA